MNKEEAAMFKALDAVLVDEMSGATPGKGRNVANAWEIEIKNGEFFLVNTYGLVAKYLDEGTKPHTIFPKNKKMLRFEIFKPPTFRNKRDLEMWNKHGKIFFYNKLGVPVLGFMREGSKVFCFAKKVKHPGYEGRKFINKVLENESVWQKVFEEYFKFLK